MNRGPGCIPLDEIPLPPPPASRRGVWGRWSLSRRHASLDHGPSRYSIPLERCLGNAALLDWIIQLGLKGWLPDSDFRDLVRALDEIFCPQAGMCSFGHDLPAAPDRAWARLQDWGVRVLKPSLHNSPRQYFAEEAADDRA